MVRHPGNRILIQPFLFGMLVLILAVSIFLAGCASRPALTPQPQPTRDPTIEKSIVQQLQGKNPEAVPLYQEATAALDAGNLIKALDSYSRLALMVPDFSPAFRRISSILMKLDSVDNAIDMAQRAVELEPNAYNQSALALALLMKKTPKDSQDAFKLASSAVQSLPEDDTANYALLIAAVAVNNYAVARQTDDRLLRLFPDDPIAHYYAGALAAMDKNWEKAEAELLVSERLGMDPQAVQGVLSLEISRNARAMRFLRRGGTSVALWLLGLGALFLAGIFLSRATLRSLNEAKVAGDIEATPRQRLVRSIYRGLIILLSLYYYVSVPFLILLWLLIVGSAFYTFFLNGSLPVQVSPVLAVILIAILGAILAVPLAVILHSFFRRSKDFFPGRRLERNEAPELWLLADQVADRVGVRPVDAITITPWTEIAIRESGSIWKKLRGGGQRDLLLGMGALPELTQGQLAAILAQQFGHFSPRDSAGGDLADQVAASLKQTADRLTRGRDRQIYNPAWWFVAGYRRLFLRVTQGATRWKEALADRSAALAYGSLNFIQGLKSVPAADDHPSHQERIAWIERLHLPDTAMQDNPWPVLELLATFEALQREMTAHSPPNHDK